MNDLDKTSLTYLKDNFKKTETEASIIYENENVEIEIINHETVICKILKKDFELDFNSLEDCIDFLRA